MVCTAVSLTEGAERYCLGLLVQTANGGAKMLTSGTFKFKGYFMRPTHGTESDLSDTEPAGAPYAGVANYQLDYIESSKLPTPWATFSIHVFVDPAPAKAHVILTLGAVADASPVLARVLSDCLPGPTK